MVRRLGRVAGVLGRAECARKVIAPCAVMHVPLPTASPSTPHPPAPPQAHHHTHTTTTLSMISCRIKANERKADRKRFNAKYPFYFYLSRPPPVVGFALIPFSKVESEKAGSLIYLQCSLTTASLRLMRRDRFMFGTINRLRLIVGYYAPLIFRTTFTFCC